MRVAPKIILNSEEEKTLARLSRSNTTSVRVARRARMILLAAIERDLPRGGRKPKGDAAEIVRLTTQATPKAATHWSTRTMAKGVGVSDTTVLRVWQAHGLKPHRIETFKVSRDPRFIEKLEDIVGLYLSPPEHALVLR